MNEDELNELNMDEDELMSVMERNRAASMALPTALAWVDAALDSGVRRGDLRLLNVVCPKCQHPLIEVFPSPAGPLALGKRRQYLAFPDTPMNGPFISKPRGRRVGVLLDLDSGPWPLKAQCQKRCDEAVIPASWLREQLATKRPRVAWRPAD